MLANGRDYARPIRLPQIFENTSDSHSWEDDWTGRAADLTMGVP